MIIFIIIVINIYLLYKINKLENKETFTSGQSNISITESIKNLGLMSKKIMDETGNFTFPADLNVTGRLNLLPEGTIVIWGRDTIPDGWVPCDGSPEAIAAGAPNLSGRFVLAAGQGTGLTNRELNDMGPTNGIPGADDTGVRNGGETHILTVAQIPSHTHRQYYLGGNQAGGHRSYGTHSNYQKYQGGQTTETGGDDQHNNMPPYYVLIYIMKVY